MKRRDRHFSFKLKDEFVRGMNRQQYKFASHYVRWLARYLDKLINWDVFEKHLMDTIIYGRSMTCIEDMILET